MTFCYATGFKFKLTIIHCTSNQHLESNFLAVQVQRAFWSPVSPSATETEPYLVANSAEMAEELGLDPAEVAKDQFAAIFTGNAPIPNSKSQTYAMRYGGHQFGSWAGESLPFRVICAVMQLLQLQDS